MNKFWMIFSGFVVATQLICSQTYLYVSQKGDNSVAFYKVNDISGDLTFVNKQAVSTPSSLTIHPNRKFLYVAQATAKKVSSFAIDSITGKLTLLNEISVSDAATYLSVDKSGKYLMSVYFNVDKALINSIQDDGGLVQTPTQEIATGDQPHAILTNPTNEFMYVSNMTGNRMEQYSFNQSVGTSNQLNPFAISPSATDCPRHFVFNSQGSKLYVANEVSNSLSVYSIHATSGQLVQIQNIKTIPLTFSGSTKCADIHISPDNKYVYVSNRGHESIAAFAINEMDGKVSLIDYYPTVKNPREFDIDPTGKFMYVTGITDSNMRSYSIKPNGTLVELKTIVIGNTPQWVSTVQYKLSTSSSNKITLNNTDSKRYMAYPNPFSNHLIIKSLNGNKLPKEVKFYDVSGRLITQGTNDGNVTKGDELHFEFDASLFKGLYYCQLCDGEKIEVLNLIRY